MASSIRAVLVAERIDHLHPTTWRQGQLDPGVSLLRSAAIDSPFILSSICLPPLLLQPYLSVYYLFSPLSHWIQNLIHLLSLLRNSVPPLTENTGWELLPGNLSGVLSYLVVPRSHLLPLSLFSLLPLSLFCLFLTWWT